VFQFLGRYGFDGRFFIDGGTVAERMAFKLVFEFADEALHRPRAGFAERADGFPGDVVGDIGEQRDVVRMAATRGEPVGDLLHPERAFAAGRALAA